MLSNFKFYQTLENELLTNCIVNNTKKTKTGSSQSLFIRHKAMQVLKAPKVASINFGYVVYSNMWLFPFAPKVLSKRKNSLKTGRPLTQFHYMILVGLFQFKIILFYK